MAVETGVRRWLACIAAAVVAILWLALGPSAAYGEVVGETGHVGVESTEAGASAAGSPSSVAGLSLLTAAVAATLWNVAMGERRRSRRTREA